jgi:ABC-type metal ion transport system substrate-binding protein
MKAFIKLFILAIVVILITSCGSMIDMYKNVNTSALQIGMTKAQVREALQKQPESTIAAKNYPERNIVIEVIQYSQYDQINNITVKTAYWLYFVNNKLDRWEPASKFGPAI